MVQHVRFFDLVSSLPLKTDQLLDLSGKPARPTRKTHRPVNRTFSGLVWGGGGGRRVN